MITFCTDNYILIIIAVAALVATQVCVAVTVRHRRLFRTVERAKREWEAVFDSVSEWILVVDGAGRIQRANRAIASALKVDVRKLVGTSLEETFAGHGPEWLVNAEVSHFQDPVFKTGVEVTRVRLDDRTIVVARDVGERQRLFSQLAQADKLATVGVLAAGIAHEVNNPSAYVTANLRELETVFRNLAADCPHLKQAVAETGLTATELPDMLKDSLEGMDRIRSIVGTLQTISRRDEPGAPTPVHLNKVIDAVVRTAAPHLKSWGGLLDVNTSEDCVVSGYRGQIVQIFLNLVVNAIQSRDGHRHNQIAISTEVKDGRAIIRVRDTGRGIAPDSLARIFEPFYTTKPEGIGTGLGLSISRDLVRAHGGSLDVESELGRGTVVTVSLPAWCESAASDAAPKPTVPAAPRLNVLVVDDEPRLLRALERTLSRRHDVFFTQDGDSASREILHRRPDVVLCDISMPVMDGFELHRRVAEVDAALARRFIFFTGLPISEHLSATVAGRGVQAISKTTEFAEMERTLVKAVDAQREADGVAARMARST